MVNPGNINLDVQNPIEKVKDDIENITGPVKDKCNFGAVN